MISFGIGGTSKGGLPASHSMEDWDNRMVYWTGPLAMAVGSSIQSGRDHGGNARLCTVTLVGGGLIATAVALVPAAMAVVRDARRLPE